MHIGDTPGPSPAIDSSTPARRFVAMRVGDAKVYIEQTESSVDVVDEGGVHPVAPNVERAFSEALDIARACIETVGERMQAILKKAAPRELSLEFSLSFEASGKAQIIPILVTTESKAATGIKITATWGNSGNGGTSGV